MKAIEIIVSSKGQTRVETKGFSGTECQQATRFLEIALGQTTSRQLTAEYYHSATQNEQQSRTE